MQIKNDASCSNLSPKAILSRILEVYGIDEKWGWKSRLAQKLGTTQQTVSGWDLRGVPESIIAKVSRDENILFHWIETGEGPKTIPEPLPGIKYPPPLPTTAKSMVNGGAAPKYEKGFDWDLHSVICETIVEVMIEHNIRIKPEKLGGLIKMMYTDSVAGNHATKAKVIELIKLAA